MTLATLTTHDAQQFGIQTLDEAMRYAQAISNAGLVPQAFRQRPADILLAQEIARSMDESTWAIMSEMSIIGGKPAFSAKFMRSRIRQAGHTLRESFNKETGTARAVIIRHDDPNHEHIAEWDEEKARKHGLWDKGHWKKNAELMLKNRALSEVMREACYEVMGSVPYTPDEVQDFTPVQATATRQEATRTDQRQQQAPQQPQRAPQEIQQQAAQRTQQAEEALSNILGATPVEQPAEQPAQQDEQPQAPQTLPDTPTIDEDGYPTLTTDDNAADQHLNDLVAITKSLTTMEALQAHNDEFYPGLAISHATHAQAFVAALETRAAELAQTNQ